PGRVSSNAAPLSSGAVGTGPPRASASGPAAGSVPPVAPIASAGGASTGSMAGCPGCAGCSGAGGSAGGSGAGCWQAASGSARTSASRPARGSTGFGCRMGGLRRNGPSTLPPAPRAREPWRGAGVGTGSGHGAALGRRQRAPQQGVESRRQQAEAGLGGVDLVVPETGIVARADRGEVGVGELPGPGRARGRQHLVAEALDQQALR